jgi:hypothetical protein
MLNESADRPAWTSTPETGLFHAFRHRHRRPNNDSEDCIEYFFYGHTMGLQTRQQAVEAMERGIAFGRVRK